MRHRRGPRGPRRPARGCGMSLTRSWREIPFPNAIGHTWMDAPKQLTSHKEVGLLLGADSETELSAGMR